MTTTNSTLNDLFQEVYGEGIKNLIPNTPWYSLIRPLTKEQLLLQTSLNSMKSHFGLDDD